MSDEPKNTGGSQEDLGFKLSADTKDFEKSIKKAFDSLATEGEKALDKLNAEQRAYIKALKTYAEQVAGELADKVPMELAKVFASIDKSMMSSKMTYQKGDRERLMARATKMYANQLAKGQVDYEKITRDMYNLSRNDAELGKMRNLKKPYTAKDVLKSDKINAVSKEIWASVADAERVVTKVGSQAKEIPKALKKLATFGGETQNWLEYHIKQYNEALARDSKNTPEIRKKLQDFVGSMGLDTDEVLDVDASNIAEYIKQIKDYSVGARKQIEKLEQFNRLVEKEQKNQEQLAKTQEKVTQEQQKTTEEVKETKKEQTKVTESVDKTEKKLEKTKTKAEEVTEKFKEMADAARKVDEENKRAAEEMAKAGKGTPAKRANWYDQAPTDLKFIFDYLSAFEKKKKLTSVETGALQKKAISMYSEGKEPNEIRSEIDDIRTSHTRLQKTMEETKSISNKQAASMLKDAEKIREALKVSEKLFNMGYDKKGVASGKYKDRPMADYYAEDNLPEELISSLKMVDIMKEQFKLKDADVRRLQMYVYQMHMLGKTTAQTNSSLATMSVNQNRLKNALHDMRLPNQAQLSKALQEIIDRANISINDEAVSRKMSPIDVANERRAKYTDEEKPLEEAAENAKTAAAKGKELADNLQQAWGAADGLDKATAGAAKNLGQAAANAVTNDKTFKKFNGEWKGINNSLKDFFADWTHNTKIFGEKFESSFKKTSRIVQGILVSQAFYKLLNLLRSSGRAVLDMSKNFETARISFSMLLKDGDKADRFLKSLEDFASVTPFSMKSAQDASKKLLAMGIQAENVLYVMRGITDAAALSGASEDTINNLAEAIGKIKTVGYAANRQILSIAEAGVPVYDILAEKLGLAREELAQIKDLKIPADVAIQAIMEGIYERYGGAAGYIANTVAGMTETIKDDFLIIGKNLFSGGYDVLRSFLMAIRDMSDMWVKIARDKGLGGLFESIFPPEWQEQIRLLLGSLAAFRDNVIRLVAALGPTTMEVLKLFVTGLNTILPAINQLIAVVAGLMYGLSRATPAAKALAAALVGLTIASKIAYMVTNLSKAIQGLFVVKLIGKAFGGIIQAFATLTSMMAGNGLVVGLSILAGGLISVGLASDYGQKKLKEFSNTVLNFLGINAKKILQPTQVALSTSTDTASEFNEEIDKSGKALEEWGEKGKKAGKKVKDGLASFDEVFTLPDQKLDEGSDDLDEIEAIPIPEFDMAGAIDSIEPMAINLANLFRDTLLEKIKGTMGAVSWAGLIGGIIGAALTKDVKGFMAGFKWGSIIGLIASTFFQELSEKMSTPEGWIVASIGAGIATALLTMIGAPGVLTAALATAAGLLAVYFWDDVVEYFKKYPSQQIALAIGALLGAAIAGIPGAIIGGAVALLVNGLLQRLAEAFGDGNRAQEFCMMLGALVLGGVALFATGSLPLAIAGVAVGAVLGAIVDELTKRAGELFKAFGDVFGRLGQNVGKWLKSIPQFVQEMIDDTLRQFNEWWNASDRGSAEWYERMLTGIGDWARDMYEAVGKKFDELAGYFKDWRYDLKMSFKTWWSELVTDWTGWVKNLYEGVIEWVNKLIDGFNNLFRAKKDADDIDATGGGGRTGGSTGASRSFINAIPSMTPAFSVPGGGFEGVASHYSGGVFSKPHFASFAEGGHPEAIIPTANINDTQKVVQAMLQAGLAAENDRLADNIIYGIQALQQDTSDKPVLYVANLIADDRGIRELQRRMEIVQQQENGRKGLK